MQEEANAGVDYKPRDGDPWWPAYIGRDALYTNYMKWAADRGSMVALRQESFIEGIRPLLYVRGKDWHDVKRKRRVQVFASKRWWPVKKRTAYIRLAPFEEHVLWFQRKAKLLVYLNEEARLTEEARGATVVPAP